MRDQQAPVEPPTAEMTAEMTSSSPARAGDTPHLVRYAGMLRNSGLFVGVLAAAGVVTVVVGTAVTELPAVAGLTAGLPVRYGVPVFRVLLDFAVSIAVGLALLPKLLGFDQPERTEPVVAPTRRVAAWASAVWTVSALVSIVLLAAEMTPGEMVTPASVGRYIAAIPAGKGLLITAVCGVVSWWLARLSLKYGERVPAELRAGIGLFGLLPLPLTGHASNWYYHDLSMISMELHVTASAAWAGGLSVLVVVLSRHRDLLATALPKFSTLATWCVFVVGLTGLANGLLELYLSPITALPGSLWETRYGVLVLAKAACLAAVAALAISVRHRVMPAVAAGRRSTFAAWSGWEIAVLAVAFGVAVVLTRAQVTPF